MNVFSVQQSVTRPVVLALLCHAHLFTSQFCYKQTQAEEKGPSKPWHNFLLLKPMETLP